MRRRQVVTALLLVSVHGGAALTACGGATRGSGPGNEAPPPATPSITRFAATNDSVFVGDRTQLTAEFSGESAEIEGLGSVVSGTPVDTPILPATRTFTLTVHGAGQTAHATVTVAAHYRDRLRRLPDAAVARKNHVAMSLSGGSALVMGGNTSESINVPDTNTSSRFDPVSETFARGPELAFSAAIDTGFTTVLPRAGSAPVPGRAGGPPLSGPRYQPFSKYSGSTLDSGTNSVISIALVEASSRAFSSSAVNSTYWSRANS